jgi:hypothetical protein
MVLGFLSAGCAGKAPQQTGLMQAMEVEASSVELRVRVYSYTAEFIDTIETAADEIIASSPDPQVRYNALTCKAYATAAVTRAVFKNDPLAGLIDAWVLSAQTLDYLEREGANLFGEHESVALAAARTLTKQAAAVASTAAREQDLSKPQQFVDDWVRDHPLRSLRFERESPVVQWAALAGKEQVGALSSVSSMEATLNELSNRLTLYADYLPKQARWQSQLLLDDFFGESRTDSFFADVSSIELSALRIANVIDSLGVVLQRIQSGSEDLDARFSFLFEEVDRQRLATLQQLDQERETVTADLRTERDVTLRDVDALTTRTLAEASTTINATIDRFFLRAAQLAGAILVAVVVVIVALRRRVRA